MSQKSTASMRRRLFGIVSLMLVVFSIFIISNLFSISISKSKKLQLLANDQQFSSRKINANRGTITDINGQILAQSSTVYNIFIDPATYRKYDKNKLELIASTLSEILEIDKQTIIQKTNKNSQYEILKRKVKKKISDKI